MKFRVQTLETKTLPAALLTRAAFLHTVRGISTFVVEELTPEELSDADFLYADESSIISSASADTSLTAKVKFDCGPDALFDLAGRLRDTFNAHVYVSNGNVMFHRPGVPTGWALVNRIREFDDAIIGVVPHTSITNPTNRFAKRVASDDERERTVVISAHNGTITVREVDMLKDSLKLDKILAVRPRSFDAVAPPNVVAALRDGPGSVGSFELSLKYPPLSLTEFPPIAHTADRAQDTAVAASNNVTLEHDQATDAPPDAQTNHSGESTRPTDERPQLGGNSVACSGDPTPEKFLELVETMFATPPTMKETPAASEKLKAFVKPIGRAFSSRANGKESFTSADELGEWLWPRLSPTFGTTWTSHAVGMLLQVPLHDLQKHSAGRFAALISEALGCTSVPLVEHLTNASSGKTV
jgi:hypothetical protein